jgi:dihydropteroate synthase
MKLRCRDRVLSLDRTVVMGILNVTPDSFSDGGRWLERERGVVRALDMARQGAEIIDVGGESTRPGAEPVAEPEELARVLPVLEAVSPQADLLLSIDTRKPSVARRAIAAGASIINDTTGEFAGRAMDEAAAETGAAIIVMHSRGTPKTMTSLTSYRDVVADVSAFFERRITELESAGVGGDAICLDPGFGFAKSAEQSLELLRRLDELVAIGYPVMVGTSRKSFIGRVLDLPEDQRLEGTEATVAWAVARGARIVRVHDIEPIVRVVRMTEAICASLN